jgi:hypothetical protein
VPSLERKRTQRRTRKARSAGRQTAKPIASSAAAAGVEPKDEERGTRNENPVAAGYARAEQRNREAREQLHPLYEGERPGVVTAGAVFSSLIALIFWASTVVAIVSDATVNGHKPHPLQLAIIAAVMTAMAAGMWKARYWAVLGFQMLLVIFLLLAVGGLVTAQTLAQVIGTLLLVGVCLAFFIFMVKAMARIQMPHRPPRD